jgi:hypothetical protein
MHGSEAEGLVDAAPRGVRLTLPVRAGERVVEIALEPAHCERLFRMAAYRAVHDGRLPAGAPVGARLVPESVRERHGAVYCLDACAVELVDPGGTPVARVGFPRAAFAAFALARTVHLAADGGEQELPVVAFSLHAVDDEDEPFPVALPRLEPLSVSALTARTRPRGVPAADWIATFMTPEVASGVDELERVSRTSGLEAAGRIHSRVGWDAARRCFVRVLERLVISEETRATPLAVVSTAASWAPFLAAGAHEGPAAPTAVHTHLHLGDEPKTTSLDPHEDPCISVHDAVTHYTAFPDPLSATMIVSLFPARREVVLYGYAPDATLHAESGYWLLTSRRNA